MARTALNFEDFVLFTRKNFEDFVIFTRKNFEENRQTTIFVTVKGLLYGTGTII